METFEFREVDQIKLESPRAAGLSDTELNLKLKSLVSEEKKLLIEILEFIAEVDRRKLFLPMGYPNLFEYLTHEIGYSSGCAQRRIDSARLLIKVPELGKMIESGAVNLTQITQMQKNIRQAEKFSRQKVELEVKKEILSSLKNLNYQETELLLSRKFDLPIVEAEKKRIQKDESIRLEMTLTKNQMALLEEAKTLLSNTLNTSSGSRSLTDVILHLASKFVKEKRRIPKTVSERKLEIKPTKDKISESKTFEFKKTRNSTAAAAVKPALNVSSLMSIEELLMNEDSLNFIKTNPSEIIPAFDKAIPKKIKILILNRDRFCQFKDQKSGRVCGSQFHLHVDHIIPRNKFGSNDPSNLQVLCSNHNLWKR